jgi:hypothetical protein
MSSKREQILAAIKTTLDGTVQVGSRIYRSRAEAFARDEAPAIVIEPGNDTSAAEPVSSCKIDWTFTVIIAIYTRDAIPDQAADPIIVDIHSQLMADRTIGGLAMDIWPMMVDPQIDKADVSSGWTVCSWRVRYRSSLLSIES